ncbi:hypothetical protein QVD17_03782 [Tagetes erecta]|uniref:Uncharacterized protein n=1 Tax=Tagetes erecta TaxID=13708 RepID=A0AAD8LFA2_TARER|nr:hypothetical protein QVD17_03782 [Tagetes erecta]
MVVDFVSLCSWLLMILTDALQDQRRLEVSGFECSSNLMDRYLFKHKELIRMKREARLKGEFYYQCNGLEIKEDLADFAFETGYWEAWD